MFLKSRYVLFAHRSIVEDEIDGLVNEGKVDSSDWDTPIDEHPLPSTDRMFDNMTDSKKCIRKDLATSYRRIEVHENNRDILNTKTQYASWFIRVRKIMVWNSEWSS